MLDYTPVKRILRRHTLRPEPEGAVVTIGAFDGLHLGHQAILAQVQEMAERLGKTSIALTFEPTPNEFFSRQEPPARLMSWHEKVTGLFEAGIHQIVCLAFNARLRTLTAERFVTEILVAGLNTRVLIIGDDFRFGCDRAGNFELLQTMGKQHGFEVMATHTVEVVNERVSSTRIRECLAAGNLVVAKALLGREYQISGKVVRGEQLGRQLGVPTANVSLKRRRAPLQGVFVVAVDLKDGTYYGVANIGYRPAVNSLKRPLLEVHLFGFEGDLYGKRIRVRFLSKLREEQRFIDLDALQQAIDADIKIARVWLSEHIDN